MKKQNRRKPPFHILRQYGRARHAPPTPPPTRDADEADYAAVRQSLLRLCTGYKMPVRKHFKVTREWIGENGEKLRGEEVVVREDETYVAPSVMAGTFWLRTMRPRESDEQQLLKAARALLEEVDSLL